MTSNFKLGKFEVCAKSAIKYGTSHPKYFRRTVHELHAQSSKWGSNYPEDHTFLRPELHGKE
jgi:hypothetical protein